MMVEFYAKTGSRTYCWIFAHWWRLKEKQSK